VPGTPNTTHPRGSECGPSTSVATMISPGARSCAALACEGNEVSALGGTIASGYWRGDARIGWPAGIAATTTNTGRDSPQRRCCANAATLALCTPIQTANAHSTTNVQYSHGRRARSSRKRGTMYTRPPGTQRTVRGEAVPRTISVLRQDATQLFELGLGVDGAELGVLAVLEELDELDESELVVELLLLELGVGVVLLLLPPRLSVL